MHGGAMRMPTMAPPRQALKMFGGDMTIEAFRKGVVDETLVLCLPPMVPVGHVVEKQTIEWNLRQEKKGNGDILGTMRIVGSHGAA
eukprot:976020-Pyramimonas_sp.AAC.1